MLTLDCRRTLSSEVGIRRVLSKNAVFRRTRISESVRHVSTATEGARNCAYKPSKDARSTLHPPAADICCTAEALSFSRPDSAYMARERVSAELNEGESDLRIAGSGSNSRYYYQITTISYGEL